MQKLLSLSVGLFVASVFAGCIVTVDDEPGDNNNNNNTGGSTNTGGSGGTPPVSGDLLVVSHNTGLSQLFIENTVERAPRTIGAIAELGADIVCAQEMFDEDDKAALVAALGSPQIAVLEDSPVNQQGVCAVGQLSTFESCVNANCAGVADLECVTETCDLEVGGQPAPCQSCLVASIGQTSANVVSTCTGNAPLYAHEGSYGLLLTSSSSMSDVDTLSFDSSLVRRGVVYANIDSPIGTLHTFCAQLSPPTSDLPYTGAAGSWQAEHAAQLEALLAFVDEKAGGATVLLMGDLGAGPAGETYSPVAQDGYDRLTTAGFANPYIDGDETCTVCPTSNPLATGPDILPDHILLRGFDGEAGATRVLDDAITVQVGGADVETAYSHHYGIFAALSQ
jgi:hypothetical protein